MKNIITAFALLIGLSGTAQTRIVQPWSTPNTIVDVLGGLRINGPLLLPTGNLTLGPTDRAMRFNTATMQLEIWTGTAWATPYATVNRLLDSIRDIRAAVSGTDTLSLQNGLRGYVLNGRQYMTFVPDSVTGVFPVYTLPSIPVSKLLGYVAPVQPDWNAPNGLQSILNKPDIPNYNFLPGPGMSILKTGNDILFSATGGGTGASAFDDLTDVETTPSQANNIPVFDGALWRKRVPIVVNMASLHNGGLLSFRNDVLFAYQFGFGIDSTNKTVKVDSNLVATPHDLTFKQDVIPTGPSGYYYAWDKTWRAFPTIPTNTNQLTNGAGFLVAVNWGMLGGNIVNQTDLQNALNAKEALLPAGNASQYIKGDKTLGTFPTIPTNTNQLENGAGFISGGVTFVNDVNYTIPATTRIVVFRSSADAATRTITLPSASTMNGKELFVSNRSHRPITISGAPIVLPSYDKGGGTGFTFLQYVESLQPGGELHVVSDGSSWYVVSGSLYLTN